MTIGVNEDITFRVESNDTMFQLDDEEVRLGRGTAVAVTDPAVRRSATALNSVAMLLIVGAGSDQFRSTLNTDHFDDIPRPE